MFVWFFCPYKSVNFFCSIRGRAKSLFRLKIVRQTNFEKSTKKSQKKRGASKRSRTPFFFLFGFFFARSIFYLKFRFLSNFVQFVELCRIVSYFALFWPKFANFVRSRIRQSISLFFVFISLVAKFGVLLDFFMVWFFFAFYQSDMFIIFGNQKDFFLCVY